MRSIIIRLITLFILLLTVTAYSAAAQEAPANREIMRLGRGRATSLDWRPDGKVLAVGSSSGVCFFDADLKAIGYLAVENADQIAWDKSGDKLAIVNSDAQKKLQVWKISQNIRQQNLIWMQSWVDEQQSPIQVTWEPNGSRLLTGDEDAFAHLWNAETGELISSLGARGSYVAWSPDGTKIAISDDRVNIIDSTSLKIIRTINEPAIGGKTTWNSDGTLLASSCNDTEKFTDFYGGCIWNSKTLELVSSQELGRMAWSSNANQYAYFGTSGFDSVNSWLNIYNFDTQETTQRTGYEALFIDLKWQPHGDEIVALADDGTLIKYDLKTETFASTSTLFNSQSKNLAWSPNNQYLVSTQNETQQSIWQLEPNKDFIPTPSQNFDRRIATYGTAVARTIWRDKTTFWSIQQATDWNGNVATDVNNISAITSEVTNDSLPRIHTKCWLNFNNGLNQAACTQFEKSIVDILNIPSLSTAVTISGVDVREIYWSPDDSMVATVSTNETEMSLAIKIWQAKTGELISEFKTYGTALNAFSWSPDSKQFATSLTTEGMNGEFSTVNLHDAADPETFHRIESGTDIRKVNTFIWASNGKKLIAANYNTITIYSTNDLSKTISFEIPPTDALALPRRHPACPRDG